MIELQSANAYKQVLIILNNLDEKDYEKIPEKYLIYLENNCNKNYEFDFDPNKKLSELELLEETKYILFGLYEKFEKPVYAQKIVIDNPDIIDNVKLEKYTQEVENVDNSISKNEKLNTFDNINYPVKFENLSKFKQIIYSIKRYFLKYLKKS